MHDPDEPAWTWDADSQNAGFRYRRMAHEAAVHRVDVEDGAGVLPMPVAPARAADGIDELLTTFVAGGLVG